MGKSTTTSMLMTRCHLISLLLLIGLVLSSSVVSGSAAVATDQEEVNMTAVEAAMQLPNGDPWELCMAVCLTPLEAAMQLPNGDLWKYCEYCVAFCDDQCTKRCTGTPGSTVYKCEGHCCCQPDPQSPPPTVSNR